MSSCCGPSRGAVAVATGDTGASAEAVGPPTADAGVAAPDACCGGAASVGQSAADQVALAQGRAGVRCDTASMVQVPGGYFAMGNESADAFPGDGEGPVRQVFVSDFYIDATAVSNAQFGEFVDATGYGTEAERFGWSFVFAGLVAKRDRDAVMDASVPDAPWWLGVTGADWAHPFGPHSDLNGLEDHPVVHVSWNDAAAYAAWAGKRLPTEAEWEKACRGGLEQKAFPWGDELEPAGQHRMNVWQGDFPRHNTGDDGYVATAPVDAFPANGFGCFNMTGNVWEWTADRFSPHWHRRDQQRTRRDPTGPPAGPTMVVRGGSYMCHVSYCNRYRTAGRTQNTPDTSTGHMGFRCAATVDSAAASHGPAAS